MKQAVDQNMTLMQCRKLCVNLKKSWLKWLKSETLDNFSQGNVSSEILSRYTEAFWREGGK